jgi:hypothetical protein
MLGVFPNTHRIIDKSDGYGVLKTSSLKWIEFLAGGTQNASPLVSWGWEKAVYVSRC